MDSYETTRKIEQAGKDVLSPAELALQIAAKGRGMRTARARVDRRKVAEKALLLASAVTDEQAKQRANAARGGSAAGRGGE